MNKSVLSILLFLASGNAFSSDAQITFHGTLIKPSCTVSVPNDTVDLGEHSTTEFPTIGVESDASDFSLDIKGCGSGTNKALISFAGTADSSDPSLLAIDEANGNAAGLAIKLENPDGTTISLNSDDNEYDIKSGDNTLPFQARLKSVADSDELISGDINATVQINVSYQ